jgi:hypothetical protein
MQILSFNIFLKFLLKRSFISHLYLIYISFISHLYLIYISFISHLYLIYISFISHLYLIYVSFISHLYLIYISFMSHLYLIYISFISHLCLIYVSFMSHLCLIYVSFMSHLCPFMIFDKLYKNRFAVYKKKNLIQFLLLATALMSLRIHPAPTVISSENLLYKDLEYPFKIEPVEYQDRFDKIKSPANTILIICEEDFKEYFDLVYGAIINLKIDNRKIVLTTNRSIVNSKFYVVIYLSFGRENHTKIFPLRNTQPNSDLAYISNYFFPNKYRFSIQDFITKSDINFGTTLHIEIEYSRKHVKIFARLLRALINIESFSNGKYFYIPFLKTHIDIMQVFPFCLLTFFVYLFDWMIFYQSGNYFVILSNVGLFYFLPLTSFLSMWFKKEMPFLVLMYFFINFRYGFACFLFMYIKACWRLFLSNC